MNSKIIIGITGGIGVGKSTVLEMLESKGAAIFIADTEAKKLISTNQKIKHDIINSFGIESFIDDAYNTKYISNIVFKDNEKLLLLNSIIHPEVDKVFKKFTQTSIQKIIAYESALIFENNREQEFDYVLLVTCNKKDRIQRIKKRNPSMKEDIINKIINSQYSEEQALSKAKFIITNNDFENTQLQIDDFWINNIMEILK